MKRTVFGDAIREKRDRLGLSQRDLSWVTGIHPGYISRIESDGAIPGAEKIRRLAECLEIPLNQLQDYATKSKESPAYLLKRYPAILELFHEVLILMEEEEVRRVFDRFEIRIKNFGEDRMNLIENFRLFFGGHLKASEKPRNGNRPLCHYWEGWSKEMEEWEYKVER